MPIPVPRQRSRRALHLTGVAAAVLAVATLVLALNSPSRHLGALLAMPFVQRVGRGIVPDRETIFQDGDLIYVACHTDRTDELKSYFNA